MYPSLVCMTENAHKFKGDRLRHGFLLRQNPPMLETLASILALAKTEAQSLWDIKCGGAPQFESPFFRT